MGRPVPTLGGAACRRFLRPEHWFSKVPAERTAARSVCLTACPVLERCREWALTLPADASGIIGSLSGNQRAAIRRERRAAEAEREAARLAAQRGAGRRSERLRRILGTASTTRERYAADPELHTVSYAFDAAFQRMCEAKDDDALMAELSNVLHHLFRLRELCRARLGSNGFYAMDTSTADLRAARAACWARNFDTHQLYAPATVEDVYPSVYMARYGALVWVPLPSLPRTTDEHGHGRHLDYAQHLDGEELLGTLRRGFVAMADLL